MNKWFLLTILLMTFLQFAACAPDPLEVAPVGPTHGWEEFAPDPGGYKLNAIWGDSPTDAWAVGIYGEIVHWNGETSTRVDSPTNILLASVDGFASDDVYAAGENILLHYDGLTWEVDTQLSDYSIRGILCGNDGLLYMSGSMGLWYHTDNGWQTVAGPSTNCKSIWHSRDGSIFVGDDSFVWKVQNGQAELFSEFDNGVVFMGSGNLILLEVEVYEYILYKYTPETGWFGINAYSYPIYSILDTDIYLKASWQGIYQNRHMVWGKGFPRRINDMKRCGEEGVLACGFGGTLIYGVPDDDGYSWTEAGGDVGYLDIEMFCGNRRNNIWAGENRGRILHFDGEVWTRENPALSWHDPITDIQIFEDDMLAVLSAGGIALRNPQGDWSHLPYNSDYNRSFYALAPDSIITVGSEYLHFWNGSDWSQIQPTEDTFYEFGATGSGSVFAVANVHEILRVNTSLQMWDGSGFNEVLELPGTAFSEMTCSRVTETVWIGGRTDYLSTNSQVLRYKDGQLENITGNVHLPAPILAMTELQPDDLFVLAGKQVWRFKDGYWSHEKGLPADDYFRTVWSHPDCGVLVQGYPTYIKDFSKE